MQRRQTVDFRRRLARRGTDRFVDFVVDRLLQRKRVEGRRRTDLLSNRVNNGTGGLGRRGVTFDRRLSHPKRREARV